MINQSIFLPKNPLEILQEALKVSYHVQIDELGTEDNPSNLYRKSSKLTFEQAYEIINENTPHWLAIFRNESYFNVGLEDHWEFGGSNIATCDYGAVYVFIKVDLENAERIFKKFNLTANGKSSTL